MSELPKLKISEARDALRKGDVTSVELTEACLAAIDAAVARFHILRQLRAELAATRAALEDRKIVDRAKAVLMKARGIDEAEAYALLRKTAMDQGKRIGEIAQQLVTAAGLLGR